MQKTKTWNVATRRFLMFILVTFFAVGLAFTQTEEAMRFEIPYEFVVGSKVLPAGKYTFSVDTSGLTVQSADSAKIHGTVITRLSGPADFRRDGSLVFDKTDNGRVLSEVWMPGMDGLLLHKNQENDTRIVLVASSLSQTGTTSGKKAFSLTCARCHGQDGKGDERADKFFKTKIPRLTSEEVQSKSDAELRDQINQGGGAMPPVEIDESGFRHRLPPQDIDAVIAYVRSLKK